MKKLSALILVVCYSVYCFSQGLWSQKSTYPASTTANSITFSTQSMGYLYTGDSADNFFAYDPVANVWTQMADFPGPAREGAMAFATDSFGYLGTGQINGVNVNDVYQYDPSANTWSAVASYPDSISYMMAFGIGANGYAFRNFRDTLGVRCFAYSEASNQWTRIASIPYGTFVGEGFTAVANGRGYCFNRLEDSLYQYDPVADTWTTVTGLGASFWGYSPNYTFSINNKVYLSQELGSSHSYMEVYDLLSNAQSTIEVFPYPSGQCNQLNPYIGMTIGDHGYFGANNACLGNTFWEYDTAYNFVISSIAPDTICQSDSFSVSISSNLSFAGTNHFYLKISDNAASGVNIYTDSVPGAASGTYTFAIPSHAYIPSNFNDMTVSLFSTDPPAETGYDSVTFVIAKGPNYYPLSSSYLSCGGSAMLLYRYDTPGQGYLWTSSPSGVYDTTYELSFIPTIPSTTIYTTDINLTTGCSLRDSTVVILNTHPVSNISDSSYAICPGTGLALGGAPVANCSYSWTGSGFSSDSVSPTVFPAASGTYSVLVKDTLTYCSVGVNISVIVKQPPAQTLCYVTVDSSSTHNVLIWEKLDKYATDSFIIYRETSTNVYTEIAAVPRDSLSEYNDYGANPNVTAYRYKIAAYDTCGNYSPMSPYHNTIHLQYLGSGNLIWNVYEIENDTSTPVSSFDVYWDTLANGNWAIMLNVPGNQYTATDINYSMHPNARYRIVANWSYSCTPARSANNAVLSNVIQISPSGINGITSGPEISLYPNPARDQLIISCGIYQVQEVSITSIDGKTVSQIIQPVGNKLDVSQLASGIYIAEIRVNGVMQRIKWVKI